MELQTEMMVFGTSINEQHNKMLKTKSIKVGLANVFIQLFTFYACKNEIMDLEDASLRMSIGSGQTNENMEISFSDLSYTLCLFQAPINEESILEDQNFRCKEIKKGLTGTEIANYSFKVSHSEKGLYAYRLFVHATPKKKAETIVNISDNGGFDQLEIGLVKENDTYVALSGDNYYDYQTINRKDLSGTIQVSLKLKRLVGRLVFDIFKSDSNLNPIDIDSNYGSTLDRVTRIEMLVKGITTGMKPSGNVVVKDVSSSVTLSLETVLDAERHLIIKSQDPDYFKEVQKKNIGGTIANPKGGVRLYSAYLLSTGNDENDLLKADLTFSYWDELAGSIEPSVKEIKLLLPSSSSASYLRVAENYYTLTNIRLKHNRIIDIDVSNEIDIDTDWNK